MKKRNSLLALILVILAAGCDNIRYQKADDGSEYKIFENKDGQLAQAGNFMELHILVKYKDSVLFSTAETGMPNFVPYDTNTLPKFFKTVHEGDSLIIRQSTDSIINMGQNPPWMEKGNYIVQSIKVAKIYNDQASADSAAKSHQGVARVKQYEKTTKEIEKKLSEESDQLKKDDEVIQNFLASKGWADEAVKTKWGTYVVITNPGSGEDLGSDDVAVVNYTGKTLKDTTFDSNTLEEFGHVEPLYVDLGEFRVIPGWIDGLQKFQKGSKGKIVIPSTLAYGSQGAPPKIDSNEVLVFDIEVTDVISQDEYAKQMEEQQRAMMEMQRQMQEQMQQQRPAGSN